MRLKPRVLTVLFAAAAAMVHGQTLPPPGGNDVPQFYSPFFLGSIDSTVSTASPVADGINPAVSGANQRPVFDLSYIMLASLVPGTESVSGHAINLGASLPSRVGVFTGGLHFLNSTLPNMNLGNQLNVRFSFSKDLFPDLLVGAGLNTTFGSIDRFDVGVGIDLGFVHIPASRGGLERFRWGAAIQGIGKGYDPSLAPGTGSYPGPFTPTVGAAFTPIETDDVRLDVAADLRFPSFQNVRLGVGAELVLFDFFSVSAGWGVDFRELLDVNVAQRSLLPRVGISFSFQTDFENGEDFLSRQGWNQSDVQTGFSVAPLYGDEWAFGLAVNAPVGVIDAEPPAIRVGYGQPVYVSPNNDGVSDSLSFGLSITDDRFVTEWRVLFFDEAGVLVREFENIDDRPENQGFQNIIDRILAEKSGVPVPDEIRWDGTRSNGSLARDGVYSFSVEAVDDNGNMARSPEYTVTIDATAPHAVVLTPEPESLIFSPNGDGNKDFLSIDQSGSVEELWTGRISDSTGRVVNERQWRNSAPAGFDWNGRDATGGVVPDGVYSYEVSSRDRAGNVGSARLSNIIVNTESTPVGVSIDLSAFSPNGDGNKDAVNLGLEIPVADGLETWRVDIKDVAGSVRRSISDNRIPAAPVPFDGRNDLGRLLPEGLYYAELTVEYRSGNRPTAESPSFAIDLTPPSATIRADFDVFSPNGDGNKDLVTFFHETSAEEGWTGVVSDSDGREASRFEWLGTADQQISWGGRAGDGRIAPDGIYYYELRATDTAGNLGTSNRISFELNTEETPVILSVQYDAFSPNADNIKDTIEIYPQLRVADGVQSFELELFDVDGERVLWFDQSGSPSSVIIWDGRAEGRPVPDGRYRARITVNYENGNQASSTTRLFALDTVPPNATVGVSPQLFSPNDDGNRDTVRITQSGSQEAVWTGTIVASDGTAVREYFFRRLGQDVVWDGKDEAGNVVADDDYVYRLSAEDTAGNRASITSQPFTVDTRRARVFVTVDFAGFSPNNDGFRDDIGFTMYVGLADGIESWELTIRHADGAVGRVFSGTEASSQRSVRWNGRAPSGRIREGVYTATFRVVYAKGDRPQATTTAFVLDVSPPEVDVSLDPLPFSPDNDGLNDLLRIGLDVRDRTEVGPWRFDILGREDALFNEFSGRGNPADELIWDGRALNGELVESARDYPYVLTIADVLGNVTEYFGEIPVDVLVVRDGDRLRVQISNITFAPNSADLVVDQDDPLGEKNVEVLNRLADIFSRYSTYNIRIEGHAVNITGTQEEEEQTLVPLSRSRAESVRQALVGRGVAPGRLSVLGRGGADPLVPHDDLDNRWRNRRVEFILIR